LNKEHPLHKNLVVAWMPKKDHCALQADHEDAVHTYCHFLLAINTDLICNISESMIKHKQDKKSIACTRILSSHGGPQKLATGNARLTTTLSTHTAIFYQLSI